MCAPATDWLKNAVKRLRMELAKGGVGQDWICACQGADNWELAWPCPFRALHASILPHRRRLPCGPDGRAEQPIPGNSTAFASGYWHGRRLPIHGTTQSFTFMCVPAFAFSHLLPLPILGNGTPIAFWAENRLAIKNQFPSLCPDGIHQQFMRFAIQFGYLITPIQSLHHPEKANFPRFRPNIFSARRPWQWRIPKIF